MPKRRTRRRAGILLWLLGLAAGAMIWLGASPQMQVRAEAAYPLVELDPATDARFRIHLDEGMNICVEAYDLKRTSTITYGTVGFTISRCYLNQRVLHDSEQYVAFYKYADLETSYDVKLLDGRVRRCMEKPGWK